MEEIALIDFTASPAIATPVDVTGFDILFLTWELLGSTTGVLAIQTSVDGITYDTTLGDYQRAFLNDTINIEGTLNDMIIGSETGGTSAEFGSCIVTNVASADMFTRTSSRGFSTLSGQGAIQEAYRTVAEATPFIRFISHTDGTVNAGRLRVQGIRVA